MRILLAIVILAAAGWSGFWWFNATTRERALARWLEERRAAGWQAEAADLRVAGFPNRVDVIVRDLRLADPEAGWSWHAAGLEILSLARKPHQFIVALPGTQVVATPYETLTAQGDVLRGSIGFRPDTRLELDRSTFEIEGLDIASDAGWTARVGKAILATRQAAGIPFAHDVAFDAETLRMPEGLAGPADGVLSDSLGPLALDATLAFDRPWERASVEGDTPALPGVTLRELQVTWGELDLSGSGAVVADADGYAEGRLDLRARNWRGMLDVAEASGALNPTVASAVRAGLGLLAGFGGDDNALKVPLDFSGGSTRLGPIPLGPAPRLTAR